MRYLFILFLFSTLTLNSATYNLSGSFTIDLPPNWSISYTDEYRTITSPSGLIQLFVYNVPPSTEGKKIYAVDYDSLNALLTPLLYTLDIAAIEDRLDISAGGWAYTGMTNPGDPNTDIPNFIYGAANNYSFYIAQSYKILNFKSTISNSNFYPIVHSAINFDGSSILAYFSYNFYDLVPTQEILDYSTVIGSINSNFISDPNGDSDNDGISNFDEIIFYGSDPNNEDTSGDGITDSEITSLGGNPSWDLTQAIQFFGQNSNRFNLVKKADYDSAIANRMTLEEVKDLRPGSTMLEVFGNQATLQLQMEESSDLQTWEDTGTPATMTIPADTDTKFFRFKMAE